jgi:hypothetical protein
MMTADLPETKPGDPGTCGFCGVGNGYLGDQGDESTQYLHSSVRTGKPGAWKYETHPGAVPDSKGSKYRQQIIWCGHCVGGLKHKYQRLDDHNLAVKHTVYQLWNEMDGPRWAAHFAKEGQTAMKKIRDDPSVHMEKLHVERELGDMQNELFRRAGFDLTTRDWRP